MDEDQLLTFEHFMAMYYCNHSEAPTLKRLESYARLYRGMEDKQVVNTLVEQLKVTKDARFDNELEDTLNRYGHGISIKDFRLLIDPLIQFLIK
ncbi:hypothetical protein P9G84_10175 [Brevibacillus centrosporus]|uniref:hypothetical protein n=1 Tax=Brevibacillus centrosporus TaxID=54910 RepID=UPI0011425910|nr:hypothetical protein [Brevibacillus centrosporus]MEC2129334.1 hypothetical protein [Brevibacillus centrosporus]GED33501.1 hypothetical protein BCE02nite_46420 [Brevibacillus centrosporus]